MVTLVMILVVKASYIEEDTVDYWAIQGVLERKLWKSVKAKVLWIPPPCSFSENEKDLENSVAIGGEEGRAF